MKHELSVAVPPFSLPGDPARERGVTLRGGTTGRAGEDEFRAVIDFAIRRTRGKREERRRRSEREWMLVDTRRHEPGGYLIREWTGARGERRPLESPPSRRYGGAIGLYTLHAGCVSIGPAPAGVDEGAGLLLLGFVRMMAVPLPPELGALLAANWLLALSTCRRDFQNPETAGILAALWELRDDRRRRVAPSLFLTARATLRPSYSRTA